MGETKMTYEQVRGLIAEQVDAVLGSKLEDRIKTYQAEQSAKMSEMIAGMGTRRLAGDPEQERRDRGITVARCLRAIAGSKLAAASGQYMAPADWARKMWGGADKAVGEEVAKALSAGLGSEGGFLIPETLSTDFIEMLRPESVVRQLNPNIVGMDTGSLTFAKQTGGATATYIGENANIVKTQPVFGDVKAVARKLAALVPISNDLLRRNIFGADTMVRDDSLAAVATRSDLAFIRGDGSTNIPKGLRYWGPAGNIVHQTATPDLAKITADLNGAVVRLVAANVKMRRPGWLMAPRTWGGLFTIRDANGNFAFRDEMRGGTLWGFPFRYTSQIPTDLAVVGSGESELYLADFADFILAEGTQVMVDTSTEAAYHDGSNVVAAFSLDQTVLRVIVEHDFISRHDESVTVIDNVTWS